MRQALCHQLAPAAPVEERPERRRPGVRAKLLVGKLDLDRLARTLEFDLFGHRLVIRAVALRLRFFHSPSVNPRTVASFQLHRYGLAIVALVSGWVTLQLFGRYARRDPVSAMNYVIFFPCGWGCGVFLFALVLFLKKRKEPNPVAGSD